MNLGNVLSDLGEHEDGTGTFQAAVLAFREALKEYTRERAPLDWANTQMNLGNALKKIGERESGTEKLEEAVLAYREAEYDDAKKRTDSRAAQAMESD
jgi:tetratricopeptide (TPR) repeat protein